VAIRNAPTACVFALLFGSPIFAGGHASVLVDCTTEGISVSAANLSEAASACEAAATADARLRALDLEIREDVRIEVTEQMDVAPGTCVALFSTETRTLQVLPVNCLDGQPGRSNAFPEMDPEVLFESLIAHELAHAYLEQSAEGRQVPRIAHEYLAYAVQLDLLPRNDRMRIIEKASIQEPVELSDINEAILNLSPLKFAAMSWSHFSENGGNAALVQRIVEGTLAFNSLRE
jgi:hypothetical protein